MTRRTHWPIFAFALAVLALLGVAVPVTAAGGTTVSLPLVERPRVLRDQVPL